MDESPDWSVRRRIMGVYLDCLSLLHKVTIAGSSPVVCPKKCR